jgi:hypothetical protein
MDRIFTILAPTPMMLCWQHRSHLIMSVSHKPRSRNKFHQYVFMKEGNSVKTSFYVSFKVMTFAVVIVGNVLWVRKSWHVSPKIKLGLDLWHWSCDINLDVMTSWLLAVTCHDFVTWKQAFTLLGFSLHFINNAKVNSSHLPILLFDKLPTSHRDVILSFIFKSELLCFIAIIRGFQMLQLHKLKQYIFDEGQNHIHVHA